MNKELEANTTLSHYRIVSKLGAGGMGEVYLARDTSELSRTVALKIVPAEVAGDKIRLQRFIQEARTVSNLNHPNILTVYEFGQTESTFFMAIEYVDGVTLRQHVSNRRLKLVDVLDMAVQIVGALNAAHEAGVTHRDLKPENVMVRRDQIVKVLDFGLAKPPEHSLSEQIDSEAGTQVLVHTEPGVVMGTVAYMSPEQSMGGGVDQRTDIWSFGVVLYEMLAGVLPFQGKDIHRQIIAIQEEEPAPLSQRVEGVPDRLEEIVAKCLAKEKDERYQTAKDLLIDLRNLRRKLDVDAEIERTVAPAMRSTNGGARSGTRAAQVSTASATRTTSSAEYIVTGIKRHKLAVVVVALALLTGIVGLVLFARDGTSNTTGTINSIAVLPFQNKSTVADTEYLSDGLAESLIYRLSRLPNLKVSPTSAVMRYKGAEFDAQRIAAELGVQAVMSGRMSQRGENLSISVELIDAANNRILWGEQYERKMSDLLATQREIAAAITEKLQVKLSGESARGMTKHYTDSNEAYQLYLKGRFVWNKRTGDSLKQAANFYKQAIEKDPNYALAYSGLAETYVLFSSYSVALPKDSMPQAKAAAQRALELDDSLVEAHTAFAEYLNHYEFDRIGAEKEFRRAIELNPNYATAHQWFGNLLTALRRFDEALVELKRAEELDPLSPIIASNLGDTFLYARRYDEAIAQCKRILSLNPNFPIAHFSLGMAYLAKGMNPEGYAEIRRYLELDPDPTGKGFLGYWLAKSGQRGEAVNLLRELKQESTQRYVQSIALGLIYLGVGDKEEAMVWLEREISERGANARYFAVIIELDSLRSEPRFKEMLKRMNLPE